MQFDVVTLFPDMLRAITDHGITQRAFEKGLVALRAHNPRDYTHRKDGRVDDKPYGGGPGMVMQVQPLRDTLAAAKQSAPEGAKVVYLSPQGKPLTQALAQRLSQEKGLILLAGRYEGIDQRIIDFDIDLEVSIGDYVLSGGELPAMVLMDTLIRLLPGVLGSEDSTDVESFSERLLDHPHYTRPEVIDNQRVPEALLSGDHGKIARWREAQRLAQTKMKRPDLLEGDHIKE